MSIGNKIKALRFTYGEMTKADLAKQLNVTSDKIKFWEKDLSRPPHEILLKLSDLFNVELDYFFEGVKQKISSDQKKQKTKIKTNKKNNTSAKTIKNFKPEKIDQQPQKTKKQNKMELMIQKLDKIINLLENKPDLQKIIKVEKTYSMEKANELLKKGWILLELFKDEKGILGYRLGESE